MQESHNSAAHRWLAHRWLAHRWLARPSFALAALTLTFAFVSAGLTAAVPAQAAYPGMNGLIAFVRDGNIVTINPATHPAAQHTLTTGGHAAGPRWSPDGKLIAYIDDGNLWIMNANGSHKKRLTDSAPAYADSRPSWSPNGSYLAFVRTKRGQPYGYLTRYSFSSRSLSTFTTTVNGKLINVQALPAPVAWTWTPTAPTSATRGSFIAYEGARQLCPFAHKYCLNLLGFDSQSDYKNGFPSAEYAPSSFRLTDADWFPNNPAPATDLMTTRENCPGGHCAPVGLELEIGASPILPGAYEGVYSPSGLYIAYVLNSRGHAEIYDELADALGHGQPQKLTAGTEPDWQPRPS
jgi:hypothetical protein